MKQQTPWSLRDFTRAERLAFSAAVFLAIALAWTHLNNPNQPLPPFLLLEGLLLWGIDALVKRSKNRIHLPPQPIHKPAEPVTAPVLKPVQVALPELPHAIFTIDLARAGILNDCCLGCGNRQVCWGPQRDLLRNWDYVCPEYQRDEALNPGPGMEVGRR